MNRKDFKAEGEIVGGMFKATISTDSVDRDGEVMVPAGMNAKDYEPNPVLLWNHDTSQPVGRAVTLKRADREIVADFVRKTGAGLVVMGTRGHTGLAGVLLGSVAQDVIAHATVPVTLVK